MTAKIDTFVSSAAPEFSPTEKPAKPLEPSALAAKEKAREARRLVQEAGIQRWKAISEAGGIDAWISAELKSRGLSTEHLDPAKLSEKEKGNYKDKKKAEAEARRGLKKDAWAAYLVTHVNHLGAGVFWSDDPQGDALDIDGREDRAISNGLPELKTPEDLAKALGLSVSQLRWMASHREVDGQSHYRSWTIPKRDGSPRTITAPKRSLKLAQRWTLRHIAEKLPIHSAAHGFVVERSIVSNAAAHAGADVLVKVDIKDFFPTITWRRVKGLLRKAGLTEQIATLLAMLCTESPRETVQFRGKTWHVASGPRALPQGAPTSPAITNAICLRLDRRLSGLARAFGFLYTRYADDLAFSWKAPAKSAPGLTPKAPVGALLRSVKQILRAEGFRVHPDKTQVLRGGDRQKLTGLVINKAPEGTPKARVPRETVRQLKAAICNREHGKPGREGESLATLKGLAAFVHMSDPKKGRAFLERIAALEGRTTGEPK